MNHITKYIFAIISLIMLAGCSGSEQSEERPKDTLAPISLTLSVPNDKTKTRIGDPGGDTNDKVDWDQLTIIVAYKEKTQGDEIHDAAPKKWYITIPIPRKNSTGEPSSPIPPQPFLDLTPTAFAPIRCICR